MSSILWLVIGAGVLAVLYGIVQTASLMAKPAGSDRMKEIAAAIQEGAQAYLQRIRTPPSAMVGVVILIAVDFLLGPLDRGPGLPDRRDLCRRRRRLSPAC